MNPSTDPHLATALGGSYTGNHGKQHQSDVVEESRIPEVCLPQCLHGTSRGTLRAFSLIIRR